MKYALYGLPCAGKTTLLDGLSISVIHGSAELNRMASTAIDDVPFLVVTEEATTEIASEPYEVTLNATVLNVGQSSCTILESDGEYMVIDAADPEHRTTVIDYLDRNGISNIQYLVFTHYDNDHIGAGDR